MAPNSDQVLTGRTCNLVLYLIRSVLQTWLKIWMWYADHKWSKNIQCDHRALYERKAGRWERQIINKQKHIKPNDQTYHHKQQQKKHIEERSLTQRRQKVVLLPLVEVWITEWKGWGHHLVKSLPCKQAKEPVSNSQYPDEKSSNMPHACNPSIAEERDRPIPGACRSTTLHDLLNSRPGKNLFAKAR